MFQSKTGWAGVVVSVVSALTAADVMPLLSTFLNDTLGASVAHSISAALAVLGVVVAKLSAPKAAPTFPAEPNA